MKIIAAIKPSILLLLFSLVFMALVFKAQDDFSKYNQNIYGSDLSFDMVPITGGTFKAGSPNTEQGRNEDELAHNV